MFWGVGIAAILGEAARPSKPVERSMQTQSGRSSAAWAPEQPRVGMQSVRWRPCSKYKGCRKRKNAKRAPVCPSVQDPYRNLETDIIHIYIYIYVYKYMRERERERERDTTDVLV